MRIKKVEIKNIGLVKEAEYDFTKGLTVVVGRNGSGKSTVFVDSIGWCLFGKPFKSLKVSDIVSDKADSGYVRLITDKGIIERIRYKGSGEKCKINGNLVSEEELASVVGIDALIFYSTVVFGSGMFGFVSLKDSERREIINKLCFGFLDSGIDGIKKIRSEYLMKFEQYDNEFKFLCRRIEEVEQQIRNFAYLRDKAWIDYKNVEKEVEELKEKLAHKGSVEEQILGLKQVIDSIEQKIRVLDDERYRCLGIKEEFGRRLRNLESLERKCPLCGQKVKKDYLQKLVGQVSEELNKVIEDIRSLEQKKNKLIYRMHDFEIRLRKCELELENLKKVEQDYMSSKMNLDFLIKFKKDYDKMWKKVEEIYEQYDELWNEKVEYDVVLKKLKKKIEICEFIEQCFIMYRSMVFDLVINSIEPYVNRFLGYLSGGRFSVKIGAGVKGKTKLSDRFEINVLDKGKMINVDRMSNGERRMLNLSVNASLGYLMNKLYTDDWNLIVFDEVFDGLDSVVREKVIDLLIELSDESGKSIVMITHDDYEYRMDEYRRIIVDNGRLIE